MMRWLLLVPLLLSRDVSAQPRQVIAISHRGEHFHHPENTLPAFAEAARAGADFFEADVRTTSDGRLVLSHDATVDRCTNGTGKVAEKSFEQLQTLDAGFRAGREFVGTKIPTFAQALDLARDAKMRVYVDVKDASAADLVSHLERHGMVDRVVIYCGMNLAKQIVALNPKLRVMPEAQSAERAKELLEQLHPKVMAFDAHDFTPEIIALVKRAGVQIYVDRLGPADNPGSWQAAIDAGADGIQTDKPQELIEFLKARGYR